MPTSRLLLIIFNFLYPTLFGIPVWNFQSHSIDLLSNNPTYEYITYEILDDDNSFHILLKKVFEKKEGNIAIKNYLTVNSETKEVTFDDIGSYYKNIFDKELIICPRGKYNPYDFYNNVFIEPNDFLTSDNWDLKCCLHCNNIFLIFYLGNSSIDFYFTNNSFSEIKKTDNSQLSDFHVDIFDIYDIELENDCNEKPNEFNLHTITKTYSHMIYMKLIFYFEEGNIYPSCPSGQSTVIYSETQSQAFFDEYNDTRIFFYSYTDISQFFCGNAILNHGLLDKEYANPFNIINEEIRSEYEIKNINIIQGTKYAYYTIKNNISDIYYYGIVDLLQMKILYNIEKEMTSFIPYSKSEMLAITSKFCL